MDNNYNTDSFKQIEKLNAKLIEAEKSKTKFLSLLRNEFDNPLVGMVSLLGQLYSSAHAKSGLGEEYETLHLVYMDALKLNFQLSNIIAVATVETGVLEKNTTLFDIESMVNDIDNSLQYLLEKKKMSVTKNISCPKEIYNDRDKIYSILINLMANAYEYCKPESEIEINIIEENENLSISIKNSGNRIDDAEVIFDAFYQQKQGFARNHQGLGIGLSVVGAFVDFLGGKISVNRDNHINIFTASIPTYAQEGDLSFGGELDSFLFDD